MSSHCPVFSFVLPAFNEEENILPMTKMLQTVGAELGRPFEIMWVNDGSTDRTRTILDGLAEVDATVRAVHLSRNFGHMAALTAGLEHARATGAVICLDADGQHPPEIIPQMVRIWDAGAGIVQAVRVGTDETFFKRATSNLFYRIFNALCDVDIPQGCADFRLLDREVVEILNSLPERERFVRGLVYWIGYTHAEIPFQAPARSAGRSKYNFRKMAGLALGAITSFSVRPLRLAFVLAVAVLFVAFIYAVYVLVCYVGGKQLEPGWTSMIFVTMVLGGVQLFTIGVLSEYLARVYSELKHRPIYVARERIKHD